MELRARAYFQLAESHYLLAESRGQTRAYEDAAKAYRACLKIAADPDLVVRAQYYLGESLYRLNNLTEALVEYRKVTEIAPQHELAPWAAYSVGTDPVRQSHYSEAITALEAVLDAIERCASVHGNDALARLCVCRARPSTERRGGEK